MKIKLLFCAILVSAPCIAMMRSVRMPILKSAKMPVRNYSHLANIKAKYFLPNAQPRTTLISRMTREQLSTPLKHQELCFKLSKNIQASVDARKQLQKETAQCAKISLKSLAAGLVAVNGGNDVGPELFEVTRSEIKLSLDCVQEAWKQYQKTQEDSQTAEQALAALVGEQKFQLKVPYDIQ